MNSYSHLLVHQKKLASVGGANKFKIVSTQLNFIVLVWLPLLRILQLIR